MMYVPSRSVCVNSPLALISRSTTRDRMGQRKKRKKWKTIKNRKKTSKWNIFDQLFKFLEADASMGTVKDPTCSCAYAWHAWVPSRIHVTRTSWCDNTAKKMLMEIHIGGCSLLESYIALAKFCWQVWWDSRQAWPLCQSLRVQLPQLQQDHG